MSYGTFTSTYTVIDIRKAFEGFEADLRMIARRTEKWSNSYVDDIFHDVTKLAESKYLSRVSISLKDKTTDRVMQATRYTVNESGNALTGGRAGNNDWTNIPNTYLQVILEYNSKWHELTTEKKNEFHNSNGFRVYWGPSNTDTNFPHLTRQSAQTYASNGYEISKDNFK